MSNFKDPNSFRNYSDKTILHPKKQILKDNPQKFIKDILQKDVIDKLDQKQKDSQNSLQFQMSYFEDFFMGQSEDKFQLIDGYSSPEQQNEGGNSEIYEAVSK